MNTACTDSQPVVHSVNDADDKAKEAFRTDK